MGDAELYTVEENVSWPLSGKYILQEPEQY